MADKILRMADVRAATGLGRSTIYRLIEDNKFPRPVPITGPRTVGWLDSEIAAWQRALVAERDCKQQ